MTATYRCETSLALEECGSARTMLRDVGFRVELLRSRSSGHGTDESEDGTVEPGAIMFAYNGPGDALIAVGVAAIELIAIIHGHGPLVCASWIRSPSEDHLGPVHAHVVVHPAFIDHLTLGSV